MELAGGWAGTVHLAGRARGSDIVSPPERVGSSDPSRPGAEWPEGYVVLECVTLVQRACDQPRFCIDLRAERVAHPSQTSTTAPGERLREPVANVCCL